ncbi:hypothetical protein V1517DRAFT_314775 [Lipomyces orientalis]|uniref:Uncharacterized protein n=1 Tax=Lipomyces orientalis TaxID=1233043 RepID=A0ACC3TXI7_9ASCO
MGIPTWDNTTPAKVPAPAKRTAQPAILLPAQPLRYIPRIPRNPAYYTTELDRYESRPLVTLPRVPSFANGGQDGDLQTDDIREVEEDEDDTTAVGAVEEYGQHELEPLGRTYVARQYSLDSARRSRRVQSSLRDERGAPTRTGNQLASELALNRTLADYVQRLRQLRRLDATAHQDRMEYVPRGNFHIDDDEDFAEERREDVQARNSRRSDEDVESSFNSIVEQIRSIGAVHDTALRSNVGGPVDADSPRTRPYHLSPLDLDGFYSSHLRIRQNAYASSVRDAVLSGRPAPDQTDGTDSQEFDRTYYSHGSGVSNLAEATDTEVRDILHRFEVLDDRIDLIRMARRELRLMEFDANASLDGMRFAA